MVLLFKSVKNSWSRSAPDSGYSSTTRPSLTSALVPIFPRSKLVTSRKAVKAEKRPKSESTLAQDLLAQINPLIHGKIIIVTPQLIVTRTSPTPTSTPISGQSKSEGSETPFPNIAEAQELANLGMKSSKNSQLRFSKWRKQKKVFVKL
jgi:hypothetical protein